MHRSTFIQALRTALPEIDPSLRGYRLNLTFEMMRFRQFTEDAIERGDLRTVSRSFQLAATARREGNRQLRNSVVVTFLEHLTFKGPNGPAAKRVLPNDLVHERALVLAALASAKKRLMANGRPVT